MRLTAIIFSLTAILFICGCGKSPESVCTSYVSASDWRERIPLCVSEDGLENKMQLIYRNWPVTRKLLVKDISPVIVLGKGADDWGAYKVRYTSSDAHDVGEFSMVIYLVNSANGPLIDWPSTVGLNMPNISVLKANPPTGSVKLRMICKFSGYFNYWARDLEKNAYSIEMTDIQTGETIHVYVDKDSVAGKKVFEALKDGIEHNLTLSVELGGNFTKTNICLIDDLSSLSWKY